MIFAAFMVVLWLWMLGWNFYLTFYIKRLQRQNKRARSTLRVIADWLAPGTPAAEFQKIAEKTLQDLDGLAAGRVDIWQMYGPSESGKSNLFFRVVAGPVSRDFPTMQEAEAEAKKFS